MTFSSTEELLFSLDSLFSLVEASLEATLLLLSSLLMELQLPKARATPRKASTLIFLMLFILVFISFYLVL